MQDILRRFNESTRVLVSPPAPGRRVPRVYDRRPTEVWARLTGRVGSIQTKDNRGDHRDSSVKCSLDRSWEGDRRSVS